MQSGVPLAARSTVFTSAGCFPRTAARSRRETGAKQSEEIRHIHAYASTQTHRGLAERKAVTGEERRGQAGGLAEVRWMLALGGTSQHTAAGT